MFLAAVCLGTIPARGQDAAVTQILDRAIKAIGGEDKLSKAEGATWKAKAKISIEGNENEMSLAGTLSGIDHYRSEFEGDFGGNSFKGIVGRQWRQGLAEVRRDGDGN